MEREAATVTVSRVNPSEPRARLNKVVEDALAQGLGIDGRKRLLWKMAANMGELPSREAIIFATLLPIARHANAVRAAGKDFLSDGLIRKQIMDGIRDGTRKAGLDTSNDWEYPCDDEPDNVQMEAK